VIGGVTGKMKKYALIAGVETYEANSGISDLRYAERDAEELAKALKNRCGFDHISLFAGNATGSLGPARHNALLDELEDLGRIMQPQDLFVFAFFGHGMEREVGGTVRSYLLPADARLNRPNTFIEWEYIRHALDAMPASQRVILLDCCRNDPEAGRGGAANPLGEAFARDIATTLEGSGGDGQAATAVLTACDRGERAYEWDRVRHGVFAWHVLKAIDKDGWRDGRLTVNDIGRYVQERLREWNGPGRQTPQYSQSGGARIICLAERRKKPAKAQVNQPDDPSRVKVESFSLDPFDINFDAVDHEELPSVVEDLPPPPETVRRLQAELLGLQRAIRQLQERSHPSLKDAMGKLKDAQRQYQRLQAACDMAWKSHGVECPQELKRVFMDDPEADVLEQGRLRPSKDLAYTDFIDLVYHVRNAALAKRALNTLEAQVTEQCLAKQKELEQHSKHLREQLHGEVRVFLGHLIDSFLEEQGVPEQKDDFPAHAFIPFARALKSYGFDLDDEELWSLAEEIMARRKAECWRRFVATHLQDGTLRPVVQTGHAGPVVSVAFSPDGRRITSSGSSDGTVRVWDIVNGACLAILEGHKSGIGSAAFSPDGRRIVSGSADGTVRIWDATSGACLAVLEGHGDTVHSVAFSPDGRRIASGSRDKTVRIWDATSGACLAVLEGHGDTVLSVAFSPDGRRITSGSGDKTVRIWDAENRACLAVLKGHEGAVFSVAISPDGKYIASGYQGGVVRVWDAGNRACHAVLKGHGGTVLSVAFSPNGKRIISGSQDKTVRVWRVASRGQLATLKHDNWVFSVAFSPDGRSIISGSKDKTVRVWNATSGDCLAVLKGHRNEWQQSFAFSPDGKRIVSGSKDNAMRVWDTASGACLAVLEGHEHRVLSVAFSSDGRRIASGSGDKTVRVWDTASGACLAVLEGHEDSVNTVAFSPDGRRIASGSADSTVRIWDAMSGACLTVLEGHEKTVISVAFSPDGRRIASGSGDKTVRIWDAVGGTCLAVLKGHDRRVRSVAFSPDSRHVVSGSEDGTVRVWDVSDVKPLGIVRKAFGIKPSPQQLHAARVINYNLHCIPQVSSDGRYAIVWTWTGIHLFEAATGKEIYRSILLKDGWISLSPQGDYTGSADIHDRLLLVSTEGLQHGPVTQEWKESHYYPGGLPVARDKTPPPSIF